jgi:hypothetical protein
MGQTPMHYARNVFGGEEDIYTNNEYYYMISTDDIKYIDVIKKRFTNKAIPYNVISVTDYYTESDPFKAYDKLILQKWVLIYGMILSVNINVFNKIYK